MIKIPAGAEETSLRLMLETNDLDVKLFQNDVTPGDATVVGDFVEATFAGYAAQELDAGGWAYSGEVPITAEQTAEFTSAGGAQDQPIYGYYVVERSGGALRWCERFEDAPYRVHNVGDKIITDLAINLRGEPE